MENPPVNQPKRRLLQWAAVFVVCMAVSVVWLQKQPAPRAVPLPDVSRLEPGDWVFRSGISADSRVIKSISRSRYSHIGMIVQTVPQVVVAHAATDDDPKHPDQVLLTPLDEFAAADKADGIAVARPKFLTAPQRRQAAQSAAAQRGRPFVLAARDRQPYYCTLLLLEAVRPHAPQFSPQWQYLDMAVFRGEYLFPEAFMHENVEWIYRSE